MKKLILLICLIIGFSANAQLPAFPGAEGYGKNITHARGGRVIYVTNTNDSGSGSLRAALQDSIGDRYIIFRVGGHANITSGTIKINDGNVYIAGQTAPGGGFMLTREGVDESGDELDRPIIEIDADNVLMRFLKFRGSTDPISGGTNEDNVWVNSTDGLIVDHCSFAWSDDGNLDLANYDDEPNPPPQIEIENVTVQYCLFTNSYGGSNKSFLVSRGPTKVTWWRNAFINSATRNPSISTPVNQAPRWDSYFELVNNFWYDYTNGPSFNINEDAPGTVGVYYANLINNRGLKYVGYDGTKTENNVENGYNSRRWLRASTYEDPQISQELYVSGNITPFRPNDTYDEWEIGQNGGTSSSNDVPVPAGLRSATIHNTPLVADGVTFWDAVDIWDNLKNEVGAYLPARDSEDLRAYSDVENGLSTKNVFENTFPAISNGTPYTDVDVDGMDDDWEVAEFGDTTRDGTGDFDSDGYTDLEEYLSYLAQDIDLPEVNVTGVSGLPDTLSIAIGESYDFTEVIAPSNATDKSVVWSRSNTNFATVDQNGTVTGTSEGEVSITVTTNDGAFTDTCVVTVTANVAVSTSGPSKKLKVTTISN